MNKGPFQKNSRLFGLLPVALALCLASCENRLTVISGLEEGDATAAIPRSWQRYGAYYIVDDLILSSTESEASGATKHTVTVLSKIKILNALGARFGTIPVPQYSRHLASLDVELRDSAGGLVTINKSKIRSTFRETGKVVVPKVAPGSVISLRVVFDQDQTISFFEHWFPRAIPVQSGHFVVNPPVNRQYHYTSCVYGTRVRPTEQPLRRDGATRWVVQNLEPLDSMPYRPRNSVSEPRVSIAIAPFYDLNHKPIGSWAEMAPLVNRALVEPALEGSRDDVSAKAGEIIRGIVGEPERAEAIVAWVQKNIACSLQNPIPNSTLREVLQRGKANFLLAAVLCRELLRAADVRAELICTRAHSRGGFDAGFLTPYTCGEGIIVICIGSGRYCVSPVYSGFPVGTYPSDYFGLCGLNIDTGDSMTLPPPVWSRYAQSSRTTLRYSSDSLEHTLLQRFEELSSCAAREQLARMGSEKRREWVGELLRRRGEGNVLGSCEIKGAGTADSPVEISAGFRSSNPPVDLGGTMRYDLSPYLFPLFSGIDTSRHDELTVSTPSYYLDTLELQKENGMKIALDAAPGQLKNGLFDSRLSVQENDRAIFIIREVSVHAGTIAQRQLPSIVANIKELERTSKPVALVRFEPGAR